LVELAECGQEESNNVFIEGLREHYRNRAKSLEDITILEYATKWQHFGKPGDVPKKRKATIRMNLDSNGCVAERTTELVPRYRYLSVVDGERKYMQLS